MNLLPTHPLLRLLAASAIACFGAACTNGAVDERTEGWPPPVEDTDEAPVLSPEEAIASFAMPPGFRVELVAAEPLVVDPVDLDVDPDGRLWVAEMRGYMTDLVESEGDYQRKGNVVVLEDTDDDGRMDKRTVFLDSLNLPRSVTVLREGVLVAEPPYLWFAQDTDGDLKADKKTAVASDYGTAGGNPELLPNSPTWGMDNWIHHAHYAGRLRYADGSWERDSTRQLGQWGLAMDNYGRLYRTWNADPLRVALLDAHYFTRNPNMLEVRGVAERIAKDALEVWPAHTTEGVNRGYREGILREDGTLKTFTAASGPAIYRGDRYPEAFQGDAFVPEPAANLIRRFELIEHEDDTMKAINAYDEAEFLTSTDERFRPVNMYSAPDGALYVVDMYQGVIQHRSFLSQYLKDYVREHGLDQPGGLGRIYRIVYDENPPRQKKPQLTSASNQELAGYLAHPNGWWRDTAQQLLVQRGATDVVPQLREMARSSENELARLHALWTLEGLDALTLEAVRHALWDAAPHVRAAAVRLAEPWLRKGDKAALRDVAALVRDSVPEVRLQLAASLGEVPPPAADSALVALLTRASAQPYLVEVAVTGLHGRELDLLRQLGQTQAWRTQKEGYARMLHTLSSTILNSRDAEQINQLFQLVGNRPGLPRWQRLALLEGVEAVMPEPRQGVERPLKLKERPAALAQMTQASDSQISDSTVQQKAKRIAERLVWPGKPGYEEREATLLSAESKARFEAGRQVYQRVCATCHLPSGKGQEGVARSLVGSEWALGQEKDLARILLDGKEGEIGLMPPQRSLLSNEEIAAVLTYIRNAWGNEGSPVSPSTVADVRQATASRKKPWTEEELRIIEH